MESDETNPGYSKEMLAKKFPKGYATVVQVEHLLRVSKLTVYRWIKNKILLSNKAGKQYRIDIEDLYDFICSTKFLGDVDYMSTEDMAIFLEVSVEDVKTLTDKRLMPFVFRKDTVMFLKEDVEEWKATLLRNIIKDLLMKASEISAKS